jgi:hypothetical protein
MLEYILYIAQCKGGLSGEWEVLNCCSDLKPCAGLSLTG